VKKEKINYSEFLSTYTVPIDDSLVDGVVKLVCNQMYANKKNIQDFFNESETDKDGKKITFEEFEKTLKDYDLGLTEGQLFDFMSSFDTDNDGKISFDELEDRFSTTLANLETQEEWIVNAVKTIAQHFSSQPNKSLKQYFDSYDTKKDNKILQPEFSNMLKSHFSQLNLSKAQRHQLFDYLDKKKKKNVSHLMNFMMLLK